MFACTKTRIAAFLLIACCLSVEAQPFAINPPITGLGSNIINAADAATVRMLIGLGGGAGSAFNPTQFDPTGLFISITNGPLITNLNVFTTITLSGNGVIRTDTIITNNWQIKAYDTDDLLYKTFATLTANPTPTFDLDEAVTKAGAYIYRLGGTKIPITDGGTGQGTANLAFNALAPAQGGSAGKFLKTDGTDTSWASGNAGTVTSISFSAPAEWTVTGSPITTAGTITLGKVDQSANLFYAGPTSGGAVPPAFRAINPLDLPTGILAIKIAGGGVDDVEFGYLDGVTSAIQTQLNAKGTVNSVALASPPEFTVSGSPVTGSGTLTFSKASQSANQIYAGPASGVLAVPTFRSLVAADIPSGIAAIKVGGGAVDDTEYGYLDGVTSAIQTQINAKGTVSSVALASPPEFSISGSPVTGSGTLTFTKVDQAAHLFWAGPISGAPVPPAFRGIIATDLPSHTHDAGDVTTGTLVVQRGGTGIAAYSIGDMLWASGATTLSRLADGDANNVLLSGAGAGPSWGKVGLTTHVSGTLGIANGGSGQTSANAALNAFLPSQGGSAGKFLKTDGTDTSWTAGNAGTVTSVALASPAEFTVSGSPVTGSGTLTFTKVSQVAKSFYAGPTSGAPSDPSFRALFATDMPIGLGTIPAVGDIMYSSAGNDWAALPVNATATAKYLKSVSSSVPAWVQIAANDLSGTLSIGSGGSGQTTANAALNAFLPSQGGNNGKVLKTDGTDTSWTTVGSGTVTSVGLSSPSEFTVSGSPVTGSGTLAFAKATQAKNTVWAGPISGANAAPAFRALDPLDMPIGLGTVPVAGDLMYSSVGDAWAALPVNSTATAKFLKSVSSSVPAWTALAAADIGSGTLAVARGGTGIAAYSIGDMIWASGATTLSRLADGDANNVLLSGAGAGPSWGKVQIAAGGSGQTTANNALNAFLPNQSGKSGRTLVSDGTNTRWDVAGDSGSGTATGTFSAAGNSVLTSVTVPDGTAMSIDLTVTGRKTDGSSTGSYKLFGTFKRAGGTVTQTGSVSGAGGGDGGIVLPPSWNVNGTAVDIQVYSLDGSTVDWHGIWTTVTAP